MHLQVLIVVVIGDEVSGHIIGSLDWVKKMIIGNVVQYVFIILHLQKPTFTKQVVHKI